ncbi:hypothetical protein [Pseudoxanthomonas wuyuanensis]|uniref:Uncharacterized protein n=1 Tax=Pseudoxanthomonas wuyuanensis TaxID=1073196 RepID=A0A286D4N5_9GAMM|nr:hypothetical protein [Pseudoxanthomonas wuyuanensis]KAF1719784.1 hypothetical protein CSC75_13940 [Pseudoxanthomonas wuyuanensis]SOD53623.1 hypothetical protein SAMN06296416_102504 [Pseudoxanthomonas wuyuanensis]
MRTRYAAQYELDIPGAVAELRVGADGTLRLDWFSSTPERFHVATALLERDAVSLAGDTGLNLGPLTLLMPPKRLRLLADALHAHGFTGCAWATTEGA